MRKKKRLRKKLTIIFHKMEVGGKPISTGVHINGNPRPRVVVNLRDPDKLRENLPEACEATRKFLSLLSDVIGVKDKVVVSPSGFVLTTDARLDQGLVKRYTRVAIRGAFNPVKPGEISFS